MTQRTATHAGWQTGRRNMTTWGPGYDRVPRPVVVSAISNLTPEVEQEWEDYKFLTDRAHTIYMLEQDPETVELLSERRQAAVFHNIHEVHYATGCWANSSVAV